MKKILLFVGIFCVLGLQNTFAQKYALIDMEYILKKIPSYENANKQLETTSAKWQSEIDALSNEVES
ncbi:MAG TPA: OmpH family outer membrane protein, partial [Dysgonamonadaceae bacterium]|nr:OmpH family outer membrane protein [Dysgonamonadaceae bacterium]